MTTEKKVIAIAAHSNNDLRWLRKSVLSMGALRVLPLHTCFHSLCETISCEQVDMVVIGESILPAGFLSAMPVLSLCQGKPLLLFGNFPQKQPILQLNNQMVLVRQDAAPCHWQSAFEMLLMTQLEQKSSPLQQQSGRHYIPVRNAGRVHLIPTDELIVAKGCTNYVELHQPYKSYLHRTTITSLLQTLDPRQFIRVHRSMVVNLHYLKGVRSEGGRLRVLEMAHGHEAPIGKHYREQVLTSLGMKQIMDGV